VSSLTEVNEVIDGYLNSGTDVRGVVEWDNPAKAPGDHRVRLKSISVSCEGMEPGKVDIQKDFIVEIQYWVLQEHSQISVALMLHKDNGEVVVCASNLRSISATHDPWVERPYPIGLYRSSCIFPGCLFNDGVYAVTADINDSAGHRTHVHEVEVLKFEIVDTGYMRDEYHGPWPGSLRIKLPWSTKPCDPAV
jgi:lipopolysaccharide transport system ATP-binding protein